MVERRHRAVELARGGGEAAFMRGIIRRGKNIRLGQILRMDERVDGGGALLQRRTRGHAVIAAAIGEGAGGKPGFAGIF